MCRGHAMWNVFVSVSCPLPPASWSLLIKGVCSDGWNLTSLLTVSLSLQRARLGALRTRPWSSTAGLFSELDVWWGETCSNYWADALNEVSAGFPAGFKSSALGQEYRSHWMILWRHILPCCHSSYNHLTERVPRGAGKPHLFSTYGDHGASFHSEERTSMPELFRRRKSFMSVYHYNDSHYLNNDYAAALD